VTPERETRATSDERRKMEGKVAVLGNADFVMPFSAMGADTYEVGHAKEQMIEAARKIIGRNYALVVVAENVAPSVEEVFSDYHNVPTPCIVVVPFTTESEGFATEELGKVLKMATGISILQNS
jgi:V/A-type H+-transporting ATPase subunit F